jgi:carbon monoxide dehydrogenase subunit G
VNLDGSAVLSAPPEQVWSLLTDPAVLARTIPGCQTLEKIGEDSYTMTVSAGVGAIRGTYAGQVRLTDLKPHASYVMHASGTGGPGSVRAKVQVNLHAQGGTTNVTYSADAVVGGAVAGVGQRMITGVAKRMAGQFFAAVDAEITGAAVPAAAAPVSDLALVTAGGSAEPSPAVVGGPAEPPPPLPHARHAATTSPGGWIPAEARPVLVGAVGGGVLTLLGVWVGYLLGRRG